MDSVGKGRVGVAHADVVAAAARIGSYVRRTPVVDLVVDSGPILLKLDSLQHTGSFKVRGAFSRILTAPDAVRRGVIAASGGNHGLAVAYAARRLGVPVEIFVPEAASAMKLAALRQLADRVSVAGRFYADAYAEMQRRAESSRAVVVHAYDDPDVAAGQGTVALELLESAGRVDTVLVAVGGGGLLAGVVAALDGRARVIAVEPEGIPTLHSALAAGRPVDVSVGGVAADSLGARRIGDVGFAAAQAHGVRSLLVSDESILAARRWLWTDLRVVAEAGGATALAAVLSGGYVPARGERVAAIVCGGNTDPSDLVQGGLPERLQGGLPERVQGGLPERVQGGLPERVQGAP